MAITCVNWNKKENTCINKICFQRQNKKKWDYINFCYPTKEKERNYGLSFIWSLDLEALSVVFGRTSLSLSLSLDAPPMGRIVEAKSFSKLAEAALGWRTSAILSEEVPFWISTSLAYFCWLGGGRFRSWASSAGGMTGGAASFCLGTCIVWGKKIFSGLLSSEEALILARLRVSSQVWVQ